MKTLSLKGNSYGELLTLIVWSGTSAEIKSYKFLDFDYLSTLSYF
jgi:hypothetical protein